jgi:hypothetical protein
MCNRSRAEAARMEALVLAPLRLSHSVAANPGAGAGTGRLFEHRESAADKRQLPWPASCRRWVAASHLIRQPSGTGRGPLALGLGARQTQRGGARMARTSTEQGATSRSATKGGPIASPKKESHAIAIFGRPAPRSNEPRRSNSATPILQSVCQQGPEARVGRGRAKRSNRTGGGGGSVRLDQGPIFNSPSLLSPGIGNTSWYILQGMMMGQLTRGSG